MLSKKFLKEQLTKLQTNYGKDKFDLSQDMFNLWYEMFADCEEDGLKIAVNNCIKENEYAPNIAGLMKYYKDLDNSRKEIAEVMQSKYTTIRSMWEEEYDPNTFKSIVEYIFRFPKEQRKIQMVELTHHMISFCNDCRNCGRTDIPTIKEYVEGER